MGVFTVTRKTAKGKDRMIIGENTDKAIRETHEFMLWHRKQESPPISEAVRESERL